MTPSSASRVTKIALDRFTPILTGSFATPSDDV